MLRELLGGRIGALFGVGFVLLLFFSVAMVDVPREATDTELLDWWATGSNVTNVLVSTYLQIAAAVSFLVFMTALRSPLQRSESGAGSLTTLAYTAGVLFAVLVLAGCGPRGVIAVGVKVNGEPLPGVDLLRYMPQMGYILLGTAAGVVAGLTMLATSLHILRTAAFGRWLAMAGLVLGALTVVSALAVGAFYIPLLLIWVLASSVALWMSGSPEPAPAVAARSGTPVLGR